MPKTKLESIVFTAITAWMMVYLMTCYNIVLASGTFVNATFLTALKTMWMEFILIFLCAYFLSSHVAKYFAFQRNFIMALPLQLFLVGPSPGSSSGCCSGGRTAQRRQRSSGSCWKRASRSKRNHFFAGTGGNIEREVFPMI